MQIRTTSHFDRSYTKAPPDIKRAFLKQVAFLLDDLRYPSLHAKSLAPTKKLGLRGQRNPLIY